MAKVKTKTTINRKPIHRTYSNIVIEQLKDYVIIQRSESISTCEVYLKFDFGLIGTLRITDKDIPGEFKYKYNLISNLSDGYEYYDTGILRKNYSLNELDTLISDIVSSVRDRKDTEEYNKCLSEKIVNDINMGRVSDRLQLVKEGKAFNKFKIQLDKIITD